jgi:tRNA1(Val) A37 N6-methylase TrmN6
MQPAHGYRVAIDPVILAAAVKPAPGSRLLDAGCGSGAASLCLAARMTGFEIVGVEINPESAALARKNVFLNAMADRIGIAPVSFDAYAALNRGRFDHVMTNPPFHAEGRHTPSPEPGKAVAHGERTLTLVDWIGAAADALRPGGTLTLIHRADRLGDIFAALDRKFGAARIFPLWPRAGGEAKRIIVSAIKGRRTMPRLLPGLTLHEADGGYTDAAQAILRGGAALELDPLEIGGAGG